MSKARATTVFTLRDLNRRPAQVLAQVRMFGSAEIRTRGGEVFTVTVKTEESAHGCGSGLPDFERHWKRLRELGLVPPLPSEDQEINRLIAGQE